MNTGDVIDGKYTIIEMIGKGGMGQVYKVQAEEKILALKICTETEEGNIKRFKREVRLMSGISHENVIEVLDCNMEYDFPYFVMPLCKFSLDKIIDRIKEKPEIVLGILMKMCAGINAIHLSGIIHRDIKSQNILISQDNKIKVSDLGLGKFQKRDSTVLTASNVYMGTEGYIPPEFHQLGGTKNADVTSDIYQIGKTIYNLFTGSNPVSIEKDILPGGLLYIIQKCIVDDPKERYQTIANLENALVNYKLSLDPNNNPLNAFQNQLNISKENLKINQYQKDNLEYIGQLLFGFKEEPELFFKQFHKIESKVIEIIASNFPELCSNLLGVYLPNLKRYFSENHISFSNAELSANSMNIIFRESQDLSTKIMAMETTLYASVYCNRYSAMDVFDGMIQSIKNDQDAIAVVEMLKANIRYYEVISDRVPSSRLNYHIKQLQKEVQESKDKKMSDSDIGDFDL